MSRSYVIAKYVDDLARNEPINVGVVVFDEDRALARFEGEDDQGRLRLTRVRRRVGGRRTYRSWVQYWRRALDDPAALGVTTHAVNPLIAALLERRDGNFYLEPGGTILFDRSDEALEDAVARLYARLVAPEERVAVAVPQQERRTLRDQSLAALARAGAPLDDEERFKANYPISVTIGGRPDVEEVSLAVMNGQWHYLQEVLFEGADERAVRVNAHHAAFVVENAGIASQSLFLYDGQAVTERSAYLVQLLGGVAPAVDVSDESGAAAVLREQLRLTG